MKPQHRDFSISEWDSIGESLAQHHSLFSIFWDIGIPSFTNQIPTAAVAFDRVGRCIDFKVNPDFWDSLTETQKQFLFMHEILHVCFMHGLRAKNIKLFNSQQEWKIANIAMDIVVNHFIVKSFGLSRKEIDPENKYCWVDTVIPKSNVGDNASFEVYYNIIKNEVKKNPKKFVSMDSLDDHSGLDSFSAEDFDEVMNDKMSNSIEKDVDSTPFMREKIDKEAADLKKSLAGDQKGSNWISVKKPRVPPKKKWESIIKNWTQKYSSQSDEESWVKEDRRLASFSNNVLMPGYLDDDSKDKKRVKAWFFIDVSGSCIDMAPRFLKAIASIPPHIFDIRTFVFDIRVTEVDPKTVEVRDLGGGTSFRAINDYVNSNTPIKSDLDAIFVITDGYGDDFIPKNPKDWTFILSQDFYVSLPTGVNKVLLTQFE